MIKFGRLIWGWSSDDTEQYKIHVNSDGDLVTARFLDAYYISDQETSAAGPNYFGYLRKDGYWYIMKVTISGGERNYTYKSGTSGYSWAGRTSGTYNDFATEFGS